MTRPRLYLLSAAFLAIILTVVARVPMQAQSGEASRTLHALFEEAWQWELEQNPVRASTLGDRRFNDRWGDQSLAAIEARQRTEVDLLNRVRQIDRAALPANDQLHYDLFEQELRTRVEAHPFRFYLLPLNQRGGVHTTDQLVRLLRFETVKDYEDWLARLQALPRVVDETMALMRAGIEARVLWPKITMERVPAQIERQIVERPEESGFYQPFARFPDAVPAADRERLAQAARTAIGDGIMPAFRRLRDFVASEYVPAAPDAVGIWTWPDGAGAYAFRARQYTTTDLTPEQIHETGLAEVKRIRGEMEAIRRQVGFEGTLKAFFEKLRTDPRFYYDSPEALLEGYRAISKRIDPEIVKVIGTIPRMPYGVVPIPDAVAPDTTTAYYNSPAADGTRAGLYYVNLYRPETRPRYEMMALSLHEAVPGHHLQIARAMELGEVPPFLRYGGYTAYIEGWGLYAESLGDDMGLYEDPYDKFGQLTYEMWRAVRLVVDTGLHHFRWDRQKAIDYFLDNAAKSELDVVNEIDRYITMPGQALAYKIGELKLKELRARASRELGAEFDLRAFHDVVLGSGAVPLDVLERIVGDWIAGGGTERTERADGRGASH